MLNIAILDLKYFILKVQDLEKFLVLKKFWDLITYICTKNIFNFMLHVSKTKRAIYIPNRMIASTECLA